MSAMTDDSGRSHEEQLRVATAAARAATSPPAAEPAIRVTGLRKSYGQTVAVDGVDLEIHRGEVFSLLGPNGAGKTTVVEILEGYRRRDGGQVEVLGVDPAHADRVWKARIGIVLQKVNDFADLTVAEAVASVAGYYPDPRDPDEVIEMVGLTEKRDSRGSRLSGGQRRRLDVALGILGRPELLFLDEPTTGFDPEARRQFWGLIERLADGGTTILLTTHYLEEAEHLADRVGVINAGRVVEIATPATLGGRASVAATVRWMGPNGPQKVQTDTPTATVIDLAAQFGGEVPELVVERPSLEEVYLRLIGGHQ